MLLSGSQLMHRPASSLPCTAGPVLQNLAHESRLALALARYVVPPPGGAPSPAPTPADVVPVLVEAAAAGTAPVSAGELRIIARGLCWLLVQG